MDVTETPEERRSRLAWEQMMEEFGAVVLYGPYEHEECCHVCGSVLEWEYCHAIGCDDGSIEVHAYNLLTVEMCEECDGYGGWWYCPNAANHEAVEEQAT